MNLIIHRGADQIGGCITEISTENCKILIDFGSNLPGCKKEELTEEQVKSIIGNADAVFYTHYHSDHVGLHHLIPTNVLQYIGLGAKEVDTIVGTGGTHQPVIITTGNFECTGITGIV